MLVNYGFIEILIVSIIVMNIILRWSKDCIPRSRDPEIPESRSFFSIPIPGIIRK